ncbi:protein translocase subunit SecD [Actinomyces massiliensis]|uniref:Protein translocase subunit SecD n=1 Tax=Actinomyces massiliensis F0489 TaxID=1125718 RepID=J0NQI8_9ACTO|nr:protein translocase subunit SecD [Actinomyces massiliensis]EJF47077.1 export membrane protein SecD [Actinomyces massiliensis F0489]WLD70627.1 protein translocase subunit SecD [Actinomyces massiliensis]
MSTKQTKHPGRRLLMLLLIIVIGFGGLYAGAYTGRTSMTPGLALDLEGGTQIILTPTTSDGSEITDEDVNQAIEIIRQRVDASGVAEAQISRQGGQNIVVSLPGSPSQDTLELVRTSAVLYFRPVIRIIQGSASSLADNYNQRIAQATASPTADDAASEAPAEVEPSGAPAEGEAEQTEQTEAPAEGEAEQTDAPADPAAEATDAPSAEPTPVTAEEVATQVSDANGDGTISEDPLPATSEDNSSDSWISEKMIYDAYMMDCTASDNLTGETQDPAKAVISCDKDGTGQAYILGPADIAGTDIANAASGLETTSQGTTTNKWVVSLEFNAEGTEEFSEVSERLIAYRDKAAAASSGQPNGQSPDSQKAQFAIVLDGLTIMSSGFNPDVTSAITDGRVQITGNFTQAQANTLANQLSFGSLPLSFTVQSEQQVSATLGTEQLRNGLIAGLIGFALIIVYLAWQYRGLSVVAVASLIVAAAGTYLAIALLSWSMGYRLSLAGVAGLIISIGITMDSFIIYFERVRDEVRNGRTLVAAVDEGWKHARQTIIVSDTVNLVAAVVLYFLAVGGVQGFAFTLGVTTVVDLAVIILFTHPMMVWILRFAFFGEGHRLSGLDPEHLGARSLAAYGKGREAVIDSAVGSLARRKAEARRRTAAEEEGVSADGAQTDAPDEGIAVDVDSTTGKDGETK